MTQDQIDLVHDFVREQVTFESIAQMMGVDEGTTEYKDLRIVYIEAGFEIARDFGAQGEHRYESSKPRSTLNSTVNEVFAEDESQNKEEDEDEDEDKNFQAYDPVMWETAVEGNIVEKAPSEEEASISHALEKALKAFSEIPQASPGPPISETLRALKGIEEVHEEVVEGSASPETDFVRALKDSKAGSKPYFRKGDILRVINRAHRGSVAGESDSSEVGCRS